MGAQNNIVVDVEGILHVPGRMVFRDIQGLEIVEILFNLRPLFNAEAERGKDGTNLFRRQGYRMLAAFSRPATGKGHVKGLAAQAVFDGFLLKVFLPGRYQRLQFLLDLVGQSPDNRPFLGRQLPHTLHDGSQFTFFT